VATLAEIASLAEVPLEVEVELDRRILKVREILGLEAGSVIKMTRSAGENLDVLMGGVLVCFGEIVATDASTGVRITDFRGQE
jgi:flagellar motor switch protein FliN/FliY